MSSSERATWIAVPPDRGCVRTRRSVSPDFASSSLGCPPFAARPRSSLETGIEIGAPGQDAIARQDLALDELTRDAIERAERRSRRIGFEARLRPSLIHADPHRVGRAISNMLDNAAKWTPPGSSIEVEVEGGRVTVRDHGPGFSDGDLDKVFDRFWRADEARSKPGSGLGLAIVQRVAEEHGGLARASNAPDGGAVVSLELPELPDLT